MREIKFRAWDKIEKKMWIPDAVTKEGIPMKHHLGLTWMSFYDNDPLMQFTGLLDKNGKEIYEGDIVVRVYKQWCCGKENYRMRGVVEWFSEGWSIREDDGNYLGWANQKNEEITVIGNIYESPELVS